MKIYYFLSYSSDIFLNYEKLDSIYSVFIEFSSSEFPKRPRWPLIDPWWNRWWTLVRSPLLGRKPINTNWSKKLELDVNTVRCRFSGLEVKRSRVRSNLMKWDHGCVLMRSSTTERNGSPVLSGLLWSSSFNRLMILTIHETSSDTNY